MKWNQYTICKKDNQCEYNSDISKKILHKIVQDLLLYVYYLQLAYTIREVSMIASSSSTGAFAAAAASAEPLVESSVTHSSILK